MNKSPAVPIAQGTPMLINRLHMLADALDLHDAYMIERDDSAQVRLAAAELAALSAQVVELQKDAQWAKSELLEVMRIVGSPLEQEDDITRLMKLHAIRLLVDVRS